MGHSHNGTYLDFPNQMYQGKSKDGLSGMAIYGIVFGIVAAIMLVLTVITLMHRHRMRREKKSVLALIRTARPSLVPDLESAVAHRSRSAAPKHTQFLDIVAEEEEGQEKEEEDDEEEQFQSSEEKLRFVMNRWMNIMKEKQAQRVQAMAATTNPDGSPTPANRWQKIFILMQENKITRREAESKARQQAIEPAGKQQPMEAPGFTRPYSKDTSSTVGEQARPGPAETHVTAL